MNIKELDRVYDALISDQNRSISHSQCLHSFGLPLYLATSDKQYFATNSIWNSYLLDRFPEIYEALLHSVRCVTGKSASFDVRLAVPGFHLIKSTNDIPYEGGCWHVDTFNTSLLQPDEEIISLTLILGDQGSDHHIVYRSSDGAEHSYWHFPGVLTLIPQNSMHRIGRISAQGGTRYRVSLQAHVALRPRAAIVFW